MQRRHFIQLAGAGLSTLIFSGWKETALAPGDDLALPSKILVLLDDGEHELVRGTGGSFAYRDVAVRLISSAAGLRVEASSPGKALHHVRLQWKYAPSKTGRVLGDHWERTYGDVAFGPAVPDKKMPWYFIAIEGRSATCFGVRTGANSICYWQLVNGAMHLTMDTRSGGVGVQLGDRSLHAADIVSTKSRDNETVFATGRRFCGLLCETPRLARTPVYGINDWYYAYGKNNPDLILKQTALMTELAPDAGNRPFSLVDAGWAMYSPLLPGDCCWQEDYSRPNEKFRDMAQLAGDIHKLGMRPALWTRPLCGKHDDPKTLFLPMIPGRNDPKNPVLDPSIEENLARVRRNVSLYKEWGYEMVKHDFSTYDILGKWGFQMTDDITSSGWRFADNRRTTAEIILQLYQSIREAAGDTYLIGCNTMSHLSAGIFELNRIGDDTSGKDWARTRKMGVNTLGFRMIQHEKFYAADGDCVGLTKEVPWNKNKQWMELVAGSGTPLFISTQPDALGAEQKQSIRECFAMAARQQPPGEPLDWLTNSLPKEWKLNGGVRTFDWG